MIFEGRKVKHLKFSQPDAFLTTWGYSPPSQAPFCIHMCQFWLFESLQKSGLAHMMPLIEEIVIAEYTSLTFAHLRAPSEEFSAAQPSPVWFYTCLFSWKAFSPQVRIRQRFGCLKRHQEKIKRLFCHVQKVLFATLGVLFLPEDGKWNNFGKLRYRISNYEELGGIHEDHPVKGVAQTGTRL